MTNDRITSLRELTEKHPLTVRSAARMRQPLDGADAQALEGALAATERERDEARAEIERLREALQFYADSNRYKSTSVHMCGHSTGQSVMIDGGRKAREALGVKS